MGKSSVSVLKRDVVGRVVTPCARREELLDEFERSALSGMEFARLAGVKYQTFAGWVQRRRHDRGEYSSRRTMLAAQEAASGLRLIEAVVGSAPAFGSLEVKTEGLEVCLPAGARVVVRNQGQAVLLAQLLKALEASAC